MTDPTLIVPAFLTFLLFLVQRAETRARRLVLALFVVMFFLMRQMCIDWGVEWLIWRALAIAVVLNFLFWFLIGRYNAPKSSDEITVIGMDD